MDQIKRPTSLRGFPRAAVIAVRERRATGAATLGCIIAAGAATSAEAQTADTGLPPVTVDAPVARPRPAASRPTAAQVRARNAVRRRAQTRPPAAPPPSAGAGSLPIFAQAPDANPYADPAAPYKANRLSGTKFSEPIVNTPRTVTVLTKELLEDKNATSLREVARTTNGITIGTGEGGNAFGDRFFIRGFDARNDIFIDGIRDSGVSVRENFFTEQIEILRGPGSTFAGRGVAGGAINIVTKAAGDRDFVKGEVQGGVTSDHLQRITLDVNQVVTPDFSFRLNAMEQTAGISERKYVTDDRWGIGAAVKINPTDNLKINASFFHVNQDSIPDFGVPSYAQTVAGQQLGNLRPTPEVFGNRDTFYGFVNRDFQHVQQDIGTIRADLRVNDYLTVTNTFHAGHSTLDYVGTIPENPSFNFPSPLQYTVTANPQSRFQTSDIIANQTDFTFRFATGDIKHTLVIGAEVDRERVAFQSYTGLSSEGFQTLAANGSPIVSLLNPPNLTPFSTAPIRSGMKTNVPVQTNAGYLIETANYNDFLILNAGVRYDNYNVSSHLAMSAQTVRDESNLVNYNAGAVIKPLPYLSVYGAFATSSNPVGAELDANGPAYGGLSPTSTAFQALPPEKNTAYEVGSKIELLDGHLLGTVAAFETIKYNAREMPTSMSPITATGKYTVQGLDFGLTGKITDRWSIFGGYTTFTTRVDKSITPSSVGLELANLANQSFSLFTKYKITDWLEFGGQAVHVSKIYGGTFAATSGDVIPAHWRFDLFTEAKITDNLRFTINVQNLLDKTYYDAFYRSAAPFAFVAPGRTITLSLRATF